MKRHRFKIFVACIILLGTSELAFAQCDQTLNPGTNLASAISSAAAGTTICLNSGNYGIQTIDNIQKASTVTVRSTTGVGAVLAVRISRLQNVTFSSLALGVSWINDNNQTPRSLNLSFMNITHTSAFHVRAEGVTSPRNWVFDGGTMHDTPQSTFEGRFELLGGVNVGVTIKNYTISNTANCGGPLTATTKSDGIQVASNGVTIGPGNRFIDIRQCGAGVHVDAIQGLADITNLTITGNYFSGNTIDIGNYDYEFNTTVTHNVFDTGEAGFQILLGGNGTIIRHNTFINKLVNVAAKAENPPAQNVSRLDNILVNSQFTDSGDQPGCQGANCPIDYNMFSSADVVRGTNAIVGTPTFVGGSNPSTWAGYQLTSSSLGYQSASDGNDRGSNYFGPNLSVPTAPSNLRVVELWWTRAMTLRYRGRSLPPQPWGLHGALGVFPSMQADAR